jgi:hypothetical protein
MKKLFALFIAVALVSFMACGGGKDKAAAEKKTKDSLDSVAKVKTQDSLAEIQKQDSIKKKHVEDSIADAKKKPGGTQGTKSEKEIIKEKVSGGRK